MIIKLHTEYTNSVNFLIYILDLYNRVTALQVPVLLALGGWTDSVGDKYSRLVSSETNRYNFIERAIGFLNQYGFSGLHLDWNYPVCWQSNCNRGSKSDKPNFTKFVKVSKSLSCKH